jgi:hypothetical protein
MPYQNLYRLLRFGLESEVWEIIALEVRTGGWKILQFFRDNSGPVSAATELKVAFQ